MDHLAGKLDLLENELRYAWRALDVLSQEYIKMWERLEKMEGLLTEQQTVITQLIDLYTADSSDNADEFENNGGLARFQGLGFSGTGKLHWLGNAYFIPGGQLVQQTITIASGKIDCHSEEKLLARD